MAGRAVVGGYGWFPLAKNVSWRPYSTLDSSGKGHMHSLDYLLPLLREGARTGNGAMVNRFYGVLQDWVKDNGPGASSRRYAWGPPIYEGYRALVLTCAAAGPKGRQAWLRKALAQHGAMLADSRRYEGVNNASLHQSMGLYAIGVTTGREDWKRTAVNRMSTLGTRLIFADGSDNEGAPAYGVANYRWFGEARTRLERGGTPLPSSLDRVAKVPEFVTMATRPDGRLEALGDTSPNTLQSAVWDGTAAEFARTQGASGPRPASTFAAYSGGYVFGRSGWGESRAFADETFYSVRAGRKSGIPHAHDDVTSVTLYSQGSPLLLDPGQWRYQYGSMRDHILSHASHNVVVVDGAARVHQGAPQVRASSAGGVDLVTVTDRGYRGVTITRTLAYDRAEDALVVWDRLSSTQPVRASQQWLLGRDRAVRLTSDVAHTTGPGANVSLLFTSGGAPMDVVKGSTSPRRGWNSMAYGELGAAPSLRASQTGTELSWLTVIAPRKAGAGAGTVSATASVSGAGASVALTTPSGSAQVTLGPDGARRSAVVPFTPALLAADGIVRKGRTAAFRATGLPPKTPVTLEALPVDGSAGWSTVAQVKSTAAGTGQFTVPASYSAQYRALTEFGASGSQTVIAAVPPAPPAVRVSSEGPGLVRVSWDAPTDTGGAPITGYAVSFAGQSRRVAADARSVVFSETVPGRRGAAVRASNEVATSPVGRAALDVPAYPSVSAPRSVVEGTRATVTVRGLVPGGAGTVTVTPLAGGRPTTYAVRGGRLGAATVKVVVPSDVSFVASVGEVLSVPVRIRVTAKPTPKPSPKPTPRPASRR
nr:heparinase II/III family protein [Motilibacter aurantiacus]